MSASFPTVAAKGNVGLKASSPTAETFMCQADTAKPRKKQLLLAPSPNKKYEFFLSCDETGGYTNHSLKNWSPDLWAGLHFSIKAIHVGQVAPG